MKMTEKQHDEVTKIQEQLTNILAEAFKNGDQASDIAQKVAHLLLE